MQLVHVSVLLLVIFAAVTTGQDECMEDGGPCQCKEFEGFCKDNECMCPEPNDVVKRSKRSCRFRCGSACNCSPGTVCCCFKCSW